MKTPIEKFLEHITLKEKESAIYLLPIVDIDNLISEEKELLIEGVSSTFVCEHPKRKRDYYSDVTYKCWECLKIIVGN